MHTQSSPGPDAAIPLRTEHPWDAMAPLLLRMEEDTLVE